MLNGLERDVRDAEQADVILLLPPLTYLVRGGRVGGLYEIRLLRIALMADRASHPRHRMRRIDGNEKIQVRMRQYRLPQIDRPATIQLQITVDQFQQSLEVLLLLLLGQLMPVVGDTPGGQRLVRVRRHGRFRKVKRLVLHTLQRFIDPR